MRSSPVRAAGIPSKASLLISVAAAVLLSACSGSVDRFTESSSSSEDTLYTASVPKKVQRGGEDTGDRDTAVASSDDRDTVSRRPLAPSATSKAGQNYASNGYNYQQTYKPVYKQPTYQPQGGQAAEAEPSSNSQPNMAARSGTVRVEPGMTLYSIARANQLNVSELARANNLAAPYSVSVGQTLVIPGRGNAVAPQPAYAKPDSTLASGGGMHTVRAGETLYSLGRTYGVHPFTIARLNGLSNNEALRQGQSLRIPKNGSGTAPAVAGHQPEHTPPAVNKSASAGLDNDNDAVDQPAANNMATAAPKPIEQPQQQVVDNGQPAQEAGSLSFRWPVKGRVISGYGSKPGGLRNEGINIAVPEGTDVRAAEAGVVAYAGNELKGYGNLVLIRHEGGWVTAYAHNKDLFVKRGDTVKRGDVISKAGQTGSVSSPQVHFEVRKGATAMDPMRFLNASTAAN
ncbi:peptidoglycan DD-metalloendopeptidase family protein [Taklimakanibacter deserti]|uniref:peptidoglycan DD-metalloendopeptidase family protein n=1 Tax=Taklimakanibacter deserti TaxID=2267839 RepID=UPI000E64633F